MKSNRYGLTLLGTAALISLLVSGCSSEPVEGEDGEKVVLTFEQIKDQAKEMGSESQAEILKDEKVDKGELREALDSYASCLRDKGLEYTSLGPNPVDGWRPLYDVFWPGKSDEEGSKLNDACYDSTLFLVNFGYELSNEDVMDPAFMADVQKCLASTKLPLTGEEKNLKDLIPLGEKDPNAGAVLGCVRSVGATYPSGFVLAY